MNYDTANLDAAVIRPCLRDLRAELADLDRRRAALLTLIAEAEKERA